MELSERGLGHDLEAGIVAQDQVPQPYQLRRRVNAEVLGQPAAKLVEAVQRLARPVGQVQRPHEPPDQRLAPRVRLDEFQQPADHLVVPAEAQFEIEAPLDHGHAALVETLGGGGQRRRTQAVERRTVPQRQRLPEAGHGRLRRALVDVPVGLANPCLEDVQVELTVGDRKQVSGALGADDVGGESGPAHRPPRGGHPVTDLHLGARRGMVAPGGVHEPGDRYQAVGFQQQRGQHGLAARAAHAYRPFVDAHLERTEQPERHRWHLFAPRSADQGDRDR
nr:hypothetical protein [Micromonospora sp. U56]